MTEKGLIKASEAWEEFGPRLPWTSRAAFYAALGKVSWTVRWGSSLFVPRWAMEAVGV